MTSDNVMKLKIVINNANKRSSQGKGFSYCKLISIARKQE